MYKLRRVEECVGMKLIGVMEHCGDKLLVFEDEALAVLTVESVYDSSEVSNGDFRFGDWPPVELQAIIGNDAMDALKKKDATERRKVQREYAKRLKATKRRQYEDLKREFGDD